MLKTAATSNNNTDVVIPKSSNEWDSAIRRQINSDRELRELFVSFSPKMDESILGGSSREPQDDNSVSGSDEGDKRGVAERIAAYEHFGLDADSSSDEDDQDGDAEVKEEGEDDAPYAELDDGDDDFEEFMSAPLDPMPQREGEVQEMPPAPPIVVTTEELQTDLIAEVKSESEQVPESLPRDRLAPLSAEKIDTIKSAMSRLNFKRTGPIASIASKLEGQRIGDEVAK